MRIKHLLVYRRSRGLSRAELSRRTKIPVRTIESYEQGLRTPRLAKLIRLSKALGIEPGKLI